MENDDGNVHIQGFIYGFICTLITGTIILFVIYLLWRYCRETSNNVSHPNPPVSNIQQGNHFRNYFPYSAVEGTNGLPTNRPEDDHANLRTSSLTDIIYHNRLDLPPTYADSTENSRTSSMRSVRDTSNRSSTHVLSTNNDNSALPPSYEEALSSAAQSVSPAAR